MPPVPGSLRCLLACDLRASLYSSVTSRLPSRYGQRIHAGTSPSELGVPASQERTASTLPAQSRHRARMVRNPLSAPGSALVNRSGKAGHDVTGQLAGFSLPLHLRQFLRMVSRAVRRRSPLSGALLLWSLIVSLLRSKGGNEGADILCPPSGHARAKLHRSGVAASFDPGPPSGARNRDESEHGREPQEARNGQSW